MKRFYLLLGFAICLLGCNKASIDDESQGFSSEGEEVVVSLGLGGEITISETPLSRAAGSETSSKDLYGINVYYDKDKDGKIDDHYAYGLFDNVADMVITLVTGHKYKFECRMVVDGKEKCRYENGSYYKQPFFTAYNVSGEADVYGYVYDYGNGYYQRCSNHFISGKNYFTNVFTNGFTGGGYLADTYYGEATNYTPTTNGVVNIDMKRCTYGLTVNITGITKGKAMIGINTDSGNDDELGVYIYTISGFQKTFSVTTDQSLLSETISFYSVYDCWAKAVSQQEYSVTIPIRVYWTYTYEGTNVTETFIRYKAVTLKRNVMTTVDINLNIDTKGQAENGFSLSMDSSTMTNAGYTFNYDIKLDGTTDNPVNPS